MCFVLRDAETSSAHHRLRSCASPTMRRAVQMLDTEMMTQPTRKAEQMMPTSLILFSKFLITI